MSIGPASLGWLGVGLIPSAAGAAWCLRRARFARFTSRMRPHTVLGYSAVACAATHAWWSAGAMGNASAAGIWAATGALFALCAQAFVGASLLDPGSWRAPLRTFHRTLLWGIIALTSTHLVLNGPASMMLGAR